MVVTPKHKNSDPSTKESALLHKILMSNEAPPSGAPPLFALAPFPIRKIARVWQANETKSAGPREKLLRDGSSTNPGLSLREEQYLAGLPG
jgi:hypothetical protein